MDAAKARMPTAPPAFLLPAQGSEFSENPKVNAGVFEPCDCEQGARIQGGHDWPANVRMRASK